MMFDVVMCGCLFHRRRVGGTLFKRSNTSSRTILAAAQEAVADKREAAFKAMYVGCCWDSYCRLSPHIYE